MKFIVTADFVNSPKLGLDPEALKLKHKNHIHRGVELEIGKADSYKNLLDHEKLLVSQLVYAKKILPITEANKEEVADLKSAIKLENEIAAKLAAKQKALQAAQDAALEAQK